MQHSIRFSHLALSAALVLLSATGLSAREMEKASISVHTSDLDLASEAGQATLEARVSHAVDQLCGNAHSRSTWEEQNYASCSREARAEVRAQVDAVVAAAENARRMAGGSSAPVRQETFR